MGALGGLGFAAMPTAAGGKAAPPASVDRLCALTGEGA